MTIDKGKHIPKHKIGQSPSMAFTELCPRNRDVRFGGASGKDLGVTRERIGTAFWEAPIVFPWKRASWSRGAGLRSKLGRAPLLICRSQNRAYRLEQMRGGTAAPRAGSEGNVAAVIERAELHKMIWHRHGCKMAAHLRWLRECFK